MADHNFKCECGQCGRTLIVREDTCSVTLNDFTLDFSETILVDKLDISNRSLMFNNRWTFLVNAKTWDRFTTLITRLKIELENK